MDVPAPGGPLPRAGGSEGDRGLELGAFLERAVAAASTLARRHRDGTPCGRLLPRTLGFELDPQAGDAWAYRTPEQTGRLQRPVDARTDLYALGMILYEQLTGQLPFTASDPLEWVHRHLAMPPLPLSALVPEVPEVLGTIFARLLAKEPDDRYQTAEGLGHDLGRCLEEWRARGSIAPFALGVRDLPGQLRIPQKPYDREREQAVLRNALTAVTHRGGPRVVLISGAPGLGKSALFRELAAPIADVGGVLAAGKFDDSPPGLLYGPIAGAFRELIEMILASPEPVLARWRARLLEAAGASGRLLTDVIGQLELVIGPQPAPPPVSPGDAHNRFAATFRRFVEALAADCPLVLLLDDLQWADPASLRLLGDLAADHALQSLLIVGAHRDDADTTARLDLLIESLGQAATPIDALRLEPLPDEVMRTLLADALMTTPQHCAPLAAVLLDRAQGNPLHLTQLLLSLGHEGLLRFDASELRWTWDEASVQRHSGGETVGKLLADRLAGCTPETQDALRVAACLTGGFDAELLARLTGTDPAETMVRVEAAVASGLVVRSEDGYRFSHDRAREAAYAAIPASERPFTHARIGRALLAAGADPLDAVGQLDRGRAAIADDAERQHVAGLNLMAALRAKRAGAFDATADYCEAGLELLGAGGWEDAPELAFALTIERAHAELFLGRLQEARRSLLAATARAGTRVRRTLCARPWLDLETASGAVAEGVAFALETIRAYELPSSVDPADVETVERQVREQLGDSPDALLLGLDRGDDPETEALLDLVARVGIAGSHIDPRLFQVMCCLAVAITLEQGVYSGSAWGVAGLGLQAAMSGRHAEGDTLTALALRLAEDHRLVGIRPSLYTIRAARPAAYGLRSNVSTAREGVRVGLEAGDVPNAALLHIFACLDRLAAGDRLDDVEQEVEQGFPIVRRVGLAGQSDNLVVIRQLIRALRGQTDHLTALTDASFDERALALTLEQNAPVGLPMWTEVYYLQLQVLARRFDAALATLDGLGRYGELLRLPYLQLEAVFFGALAIAGASAGEARRRLADLRADAERLAELAAVSAENFAHRAALVRGELARAEGDADMAGECFAIAIAHAERHGAPNVAGLAHESAARLAAELDLEVVAARHRAAAIDAYGEWGARAKVELLEREVRAHAGAAGTAEPDDTLDALAVAKAAQAISGEVIHERVLERLLETVVEIAGASAGTVLLYRDGRAMVVAAARATEAGLAVTVHDPPLDPAAEPLSEVAATTLPLSVVNYVARTRGPLVLPDPGRRAALERDPYMAAHGVRSLLCTPLLGQGELRGMLLLENTLIAGAFTPGRLAALDVVAAQAVISLENAALYADLRREIAEREQAQRDLRESEEQLRQAQKMEAVGRLAGGITHDFNNLLTAIQLFILLALQHVPEGDPLRQDLENIQRAAKRAEALTGQLLAFSRKQLVTPQQLDLGAVLDEVAPMLHRLAGEDIKLVVEVAPKSLVRADRGQLEQVILNLSINARDAMPDGGRLTIRATPVASGAAARPLVHLTVADTGSGMDAETQSHIFEPFFTTKPAGSGTGLGLSTVFGIVQQGGGKIAVSSAPGRGTEVTVSLPAAIAIAEHPEALPESTRDIRGIETILLAEDDELVRRLTAATLSNLGYAVREAGDGAAALELLSRDGAVDLLVSDVAMPNLGGIELARRLRELAPHVPVLFVSAYPRDLPTDARDLPSGVAYLQKPFTAEQIGLAIRRLLDREA